ncbi:MAG TPA: rhomboid-like protein [Mycobacteriales bacterium]|nr:rhomboid-like protein [Mycobacteriales bacterium]
MAPLRHIARLPRVAVAFVVVQFGAYLWWLLQTPQIRLSVLVSSSTDIAHLERVPWLVLPASSIWSGDLFGYWAVVVLLCVGALERLRGGIVTLVTGAIAHVVGTLVSQGVTAVRIAAGELSGSARHLLDVGPSYAVAACATAVVFSPGAHRLLRWACALTLVPLVVTAFDFSDESQVAAIGHAVAMLVGVVAGRRRTIARNGGLTPSPA